MELVLAGFGVGKDLSFLQPAETGVLRGMVRFNPDSDRAYYGPTNLNGPEPRPFALAKTAETYRIVVIGASTVHGSPYPPELAFPRLLEITLQRQGIKRHFEVLNAGIVAITSTCEADILQQVIPCDPNLTIVYTGHNEFVGPGGVGSRLPIPPGWAPAYFLARRTRLHQVTSRIFGFQKQDNRPLLDQLPGDTRIPLDGTKFRRAEDYLRRNLERMIWIADGARIPLLFTTPAVNLRSQSPLVSLSRDGLLARESEEWQNAMDLGEKMLRKNDHHAALSAFDQARAIDDGHALLAFRRAQCLEGLHRWKDALEAYQAACDLDGCRIRAPSSFAKIVAEVAGGVPADSTVHFLDTASAFARGTLNGIPGDESFLEHVHVTYSGNWRLAIILAEFITREILGESWQESLIPSAADRDELCGVMLQDHFVAKGLVQMMLQRPPHNQAADVALQFQAIHSECWRLSEQLSPEEAEVLGNLSLHQLQADSIRALADRYDNAEMHREVGDVLRRGVCRQPWRLDFLLDLAEFEFRDGNNTQAHALLEQAEKWKPDRVRVRRLRRELEGADKP